VALMSFDSFWAYRSVAHIEILDVISNLMDTDKKNT